ncbi:MAG: type 1 glutamine amidotransferase [Desulfobulbaceae bacterium]|nr:type 1 glutamine amidotransferase [Desulfobulbaceae bacterium]
MKKNIAVFQHVSWEGPGQFLLDAADRCNTQLNIIKVWQEEIPDLSAYDGLIVLGGSPNIDQEDEYPFLRNEKQAIRSWLAIDKPCLGICLGHQLVADALGARIAPNFCYSFGFTEGHLTHDGRNHPVFKGSDIRFPLYKWHGYAVIPPVPSHFHILVTSTECQVESFTVKNREHIIGVQFDNHAASPSDVVGWLKENADWLASVEENFDPQKIIAQAERHQAKTKEHFLQFFENFINMTDRNSFIH